MKPRTREIAVGSHEPHEGNVPDPDPTLPRPAVTPLCVLPIDVLDAREPSEYRLPAISNVESEAGEPSPPMTEMDVGKAETPLRAPPWRCPLLLHASAAPGIEPLPSSRPEA